MNPYFVTSIVAAVAAVTAYIRWDLRTWGKKLDRLALVAGAARDRRSEDIYWRFFRELEEATALMLGVRRGDREAYDELYARLDRDPVIPFEVAVDSAGFVEGIADAADEGLASLRRIEVVA